MTTATKSELSELDNALFKKLQQLTMKIPKDPSLYRQDVLKYSKMYQQEFQKLLTDIQRKNERFAQLLIFLSRCVKHFPKQLAFVPRQVIDLLKNHGPNLHAYARKKCVGSIMILRAKNILYPVETIQFLLTLFNIQDKQLRRILYKYILNDIRRMNKHHKNIKINQQIRNSIYENIIKNSDKMTQKSLQLMIDLYKRNIWTDNRSVNIIAEGCFNQSAKIRMIAAHFLIATTQPLQEMEDSDEDGNAVNPSDIKFIKGITKHTKNKQKQIQKEKKRAERRLRKKQIQGRRQNFMPIDVIYSPQDFGEKLFNFMSKKNVKFAHKLVYMSLISRLIWRHKLIILPWYGSLIKYMQPKQKEVHRVLTYFAESVHQNLPDDEVETIIKHIIQKFVNDRCSQFAMTIGLNTIREVFVKMNSIITEDMMLYLSTYYDYKNRNVSTAAKALINAVRDINPYLLQKKYRGKNPNEAVDYSRVGRQNVKNSIDGAELLGHKGQVPIYMDKVLTDEDFKQIRKLKRKQQQERQWENIQMMQQKNQSDEEGQEEEEQDGEGQDEQEEQSQENSSEDQGEIDWGDCQQIQDISGEEQEDQQQQGQNQQDSKMQDQSGQNEDEEELNQEEDGQEQIDEDNQEQEQGSQQISDEIDEQIQQEQLDEEISQKPKKTKKKQQAETKTKTNNAKKPVQQQISDQSSYVQQSQQQNPHGFLNVNQIAFYKRSKTEIKAERRKNNESKQKFKHTPKQKKGGTTNKEKNKLKPLMMLRDKKNRIRSQEKQVKLRIKNLKNQLGKIKSGKQAKRLKNKKITKKAPRR